MRRCNAHQHRDRRQAHERGHEADGPDDQAGGRGGGPQAPGSDPRADRGP